MANQLQYETSPYLLQHAENPVNWFSWGDEALNKAIDEDKPIIVSIGYSACHWCHVMEHESFEKEAVARVMNENFVCIKVDREERPDVDAVYMEAVQAMGVNGGWPLNVFLMPDAKPFYGVTYVPMRNWVNLLASVRSAFDEQREQVAESAEGFARHLNTSESERFNLAARPPQFTPDLLDGFYHKIAVTFDTRRGGPDRAPKFPMPSIYGFLLRYYAESGDESALRQTELTLNRMALGGIYDQIGGGFSRYSVDAEWFAPHFEKMLYDNAQLLTLYSEAYSVTNSELYRKTVFQTIAFLQRELMSNEGGFFSALDADSEGVEGKFYTWTTPELRQLLGNDFDWFTDLYSVTEDGNWEHSESTLGRNILHRTETDAEFARHADWDPADVATMLEAPHAKLMAERDTRIRPGLDDKILCSWNGLMLKGLVTAYRTFDEPEFLATALRLAFFIRHKLTDSRNGRLWHTYKNGRARLAGYLDDYAAVIDGYIALYQATFNAEWLTEADRLTQYVITNFDDPDEDFFFFTDKNGEGLIARKKELFDNVIPASNSIMAHNLFTLSLLLDRPDYADRVDRMLGRVEPLLAKNADYLTHWAALYTQRVSPTAEIAIVGPNADVFRKQIDARFMPNKVLVGTDSISDLPLLQGRGLVDGKTAIYVCYDRACQLPVTEVEAIWPLIR